MKINISMLTIIFAFFACTMATPSTAQTNLQVCHSGGPPVLAVIYETYNGLFQSHKVSGWYKLQSGGCVREELSGRDIRSFAFAAVNERGQLVALPFEYDTGRRSFRGSVGAICIPVTKDLEAFNVSTPSVAGVTPPCREGHVPLTTSFSIMGGTVGQRTRMSVRGVERLPPPDPAYTRVWEERFGVAAVEAAAALEQERAEAAAARAQERQAEIVASVLRRGSETVVLEELHKTCGPVNAASLETVTSVSHLPSRRDGLNTRSQSATQRPTTLSDLSCGNTVRKFDRPPQGWRNAGDHYSVCETHSRLVFLNKEQEMLERFSLDAEQRCQDMIDNGNGRIVRTFRQLTGSTKEYESCLKEMENIKKCKTDLAAGKAWIWRFYNIIRQ